MSADIRNMLLEAYQDHHAGRLSGLALQEISKNAGLEMINSYKRAPLPTRPPAGDVKRMKAYVFQKAQVENQNDSNKHWLKELKIHAKEKANHVAEKRIEGLLYEFKDIRHF